MASNDKKIPTVTITTARPRNSSESSISPSIRTPRAARFAEATAVNSPIEPSKAGRNPFTDPPTNHYRPQPQPSDVGFGYISEKHGSVVNQEVEMEETDTRYLGPKTPLKSAMKSPGAPPRMIENPLSPTFREEQILEKVEARTDKEQAADLKVKVRVRLAKIVLRCTNFSCSLIVLSMLATTFTIFNTTKSLPPRSGSPAWAPSVAVWPQITVLVMSCISLAISVCVLWTNFRRGHQRAEKVAVYYTTFTVAVFIFSVVMWGLGAGILQQSKANGNGNDVWGWSCKDNKRKALFQNDVAYDLVCRLQNWSLVCCIIEVVVELITIAIYAVVFYRFWSKRKLRKSMAVRDRARSDVYLAQLRSQSAPNTPAFGPLSPRDGGWRPPPNHPLSQDPISAAERGESEGVQFPRGFAQPQPFTLLAPPPAKSTPKVSQVSFQPAPAASRDHSPPPPPPPQSPKPEIMQEHMPAAPGEQQYAAVPIPGAYASSLTSPTAQPQMGFNFSDH